MLFRSAEWPAAALAFDMRFTAVSSKGERMLAATAFFRGLYETALEPGEVLKSIHVPLPGANRRAAFGELTRRSGDYAIVGAFVNADTSGGKLTATRVAFFAVAAQALLAKGAMAALDGSAGIAPLASSACAATAKNATRVAISLPPLVPALTKAPTIA